MGRRYFCIFGPDLSGDFGTLHGIGGLEATISLAANGRSVTHEAAPIKDFLGNVLGHVDGKANRINWSPTATSAYGPAANTTVKVFGEDTDKWIDAVSWRGYSVDPTGFINMGERKYDYQSGRFISTDPLGHAATPDLYSFAAGDPINVGDPTGRFNQGLSSLGYHSQGNIHRAQAAYSAGQIAAEHGGPDVNPSQVAMAKYESLSKGDPHTQAQWEANLMGYGGATVAATSLPALSVLMPAVAIELAPAVVATKTLVATKGAELIGRASSQYTLAGQHTYSHVNAIAHTQLFAIKGVSVTALGGYITFDTIDSFTTGALGSPPYSTGFESLSFGGKLLEQIGIVNPYSQAVQGFGYFAHLKSKAYNLNSQLSDSSTSFSPIGSNPISK